MWILKKISLYKWDKDWLSYKKVYRDEVKTSGMIHLFAKFIRKVYKHTWQSLSDAKWDEFVAELERLGSIRGEEINKEAYDRYLQRGNWYCRQESCPKWKVLFRP